MDMRLKQEVQLDGLARQLQVTLPAGIRVLNIERVDDRQPALQTQVASAEYEVTLTEPIDRFELERRIGSAMESGSLPRERRGKSYDLRPLIEELIVLESNSLLLEEAPALPKIFMRLSAREGATGRPEEVLDVLGIAFEGTRIERTKLHFSLAEVGGSTDPVPQPDLKD